MIQDADLVQLLPAGHSVGSIRTRRPLMYVFSGGNEDAAFFSVNGFSILLDGGDEKVVPYWNLIRNYDKISAAVVTRVSPKCLQGISAILMRKCLQECHPNFGSLICNLPPSNITNGDSESSKVLHAMHKGLRVAGLKPIEAFVSPKLEAITLYEVIGEGALRMIVLNPERGSKDLTSLVHALKTNENIEKFAASTSLALLLIWHPSDHSLPVSRILITGSCPLDKLYASLEKLKNQEYLRYPQFTQATKEKPPGKIVRKPIPTKNHSNSSSLRSTTQMTTFAPDEPQKKAVRQSLAPSRAVSGRRSVTESKGSATGAAKSYAPETKMEDRSGKSRSSNVRKSFTPEIKPKERNAGKTKAVDKVKVKVQSSDPVAVDVQPAEVQQNLEASIDLPTLSDLQDATIPSHLEFPCEAKHFFETENSTPTSPENPQTPESVVGPQVPDSQVPDDNGLLDGIEEPMQVRKISMDYLDEAKNLIGDFVKEAIAVLGEGFDFSNSTLPSQDTLLLDSTPITQSAPSFESADVVYEYSDTSASKEKTAHSDENISETAVHDQEVIHQQSLQDLFGDVTPFLAGLVTGIVDDSPILQKLSPVNNEFEMSKSSVTPQSLNKLNNGTLEYLQDDKHKGNENTMILLEETEKVQSGIKREAFANQNSDSDTAIIPQPDPVLDKVIDSLAEASAMVDNARKMSELEGHVQDPTTQIINSAQLATEAIATGCTEQLTGVSDVFDERVTNITHDINDNANALMDQNTYEEKHAEELYLPPMTSSARARARPVANGVKTKPKLSQPLYFDIVFVPHHGAHPLLKDEEASKAFVTSVRSRRYVLSGKDSIRTYFIDGLIAGKAAWNKPELEVDVLPTHDSDEMTLYSHQKANEIAEAGITLRCSVERCTLRLSSGGTDDTCPAFKFEI